jgi:hypothetical protein
MSKSIVLIHGGFVDGSGCLKSTRKQANYEEWAQDSSARKTLPPPL